MNNNDNKVKRYNFGLTITTHNYGFSHSEPLVYEDPNGDYVHINDYNKLESKWQQIETAPDCNETEVLLYDSESGKILVGKKIYKNENIKYCDWIETDEELKHAQTEYISGEIYFNPSHWLPLPKPPQN